MILHCKPKLKIMANQFLGRDHSILLDEAKKMTKRFREQKDAIMRDEHKGKHLIPHCESFDREAFDKLLQNENCKGVRIYYGMKEGNDRVHAIIVGFDAEGKDILPGGSVAMDATDPKIIEDGKTCPDYCPPPSGLNS
jgi:polyphosphate kinase 2 (PPK2 family)